MSARPTLRGLAGALLCACAAFGPIALGAAPAAAQDDAAPLPLSGPAYVRARAAQEALARGDYAEAVDDAREGLRQRPDSAELRLLLVQALEAAGRADEAVEAGAGFVAAGDRSRAMLSQLAAARRALDQARRGAAAPKPPPAAQGAIEFSSAADAAQSAGAAFARGDYPAALAAAEAARSLAPDAFGTLRDDMKAAIDATTPATEQPAYQAAAAAYAAFARRDFSGARAAAAEAARLDPAYRALLARIEAAARAPASPPPSPAYRAAAAAYKAFAAHEYRAAARGAAQAVRFEPTNRAYRALLVDALSASGDLAGAEAAADAALRAFGREAHLFAARGYIRQKLGRFGGAAQDFSDALALRAGSPAEREGWRLALAGALTAAGRPQEALDALAPLPPTARTLLARAAALKALRRDEEALAAFAQAQAAARTKNERLDALRGRIDVLAALKRADEARALFDEALAQGALADLSRVDFAYLAARAGDNARAARAFGEARAAGALPPRANLDAGYAAMRAFDNDAAVSFFEAGVDAARAGEFPATEQEIFQIRRQIADLDRTWGVNAMASYGKVGVTPGSALAPITAAGAVAQVGAELYWRPPVIGYRDRATFELFVRSFQTLYDENNGPTGWRTNQTAAGARWKPFGDYNVVFEAARVFGLGDAASSNWMLRAAFSQGEGLDLRVDEPSWLMWNVNAEAVHYFESEETIVNAEGRIGQSFRVDGIGDGLVLTPYWVLGGGYDNVFSEPTAIGTGPGLSARLWFRGDAYHAPRSFVEASVQYRVPLAGGERARGLFAQLSVSY
ncbi:tetratricopeptide repeat protein [Methylocella sp.]|uniref:NfrA family protein n=1 Tax=Methylocella sp. TaxID=1978226 RepID=UPI0035B299DB